MIRQGPGRASCGGASRKEMARGRLLNLFIKKENIARRPFLNSFDHPLGNGPPKRKGPAEAGPSTRLCGRKGHSLPQQGNLARGLWVPVTAARKRECVFSATQRESPAVDSIWVTGDGFPSRCTKQYGLSQQFRKFPCSARADTCASRSFPHSVSRFAFPSDAILPHIPNQRLAALVHIT